jgi:histidinol phosphatase-like enzyme
MNPYPSIIAILLAECHLWEFQHEKVEICDVFWCLHEKVEICDVLDKVKKDLLDAEFRKFLWEKNGENGPHGIS